METQPTQQPTPQSAPQPPSAAEQEVRQWGMILHLSQLAGVVVPVAGLVVPIIIWQLKKNEMPGLDAHGKVIVNWIISVLIYFMVAFVLTFVIIGIPIMIVLGLLCVIYPIIGGIKANDGELWPYPGSITILK